MCTCHREYLFHSSDHHLGIRDLSNIQSEFWVARNKWMNIGLALKLEKSDLEAIQIRCRENADRCCREMLDKWLRSDRPLMADLIAALRQPTVGFEQLAEDLERNHRESNTLASQDPEVSNLSFPHIKHEICDEQTRAELEQRLQYDTSEIIRMFKILRQGFFDTLEDHSDHTPRYTRYLKDFLESDDLKEPQSISEIHKIIQEHSDFFNYDLVEDMIKLAGTEKDKENCKEYLHKFHAYAKRRIFECPSALGGTLKSETKLVAKLDSNYDRCSAEKINKFRYRLSAILNIKAHVLRLLSVEKGCITLVYAIPGSTQ